MRTGEGLGGVPGWEGRKGWGQGGEELDGWSLLARSLPSSPLLPLPSLVMKRPRLSLSLTIILDHRQLFPSTSLSCCVARWLVGLTFLLSSLLLRFILVFVLILVLFLGLVLLLLLLLKKSCKKAQRPNFHFLSL